MFLIAVQMAGPWNPDNPFQYLSRGGQSAPQTMASSLRFIWPSGRIYRGSAVII